MNKKNFLSLLFIFFNIFLYAEKVFVSPIIVYNQSGEKIESKDNPVHFVLSNLSKHWFGGLISFEYGNPDIFGYTYTIVDAQRISAVTNATYLLYGYFQKSDNYWFGNLKIFDKNRNCIVKEFYSSDELDKYERFITNLTEKVLVGIEEITGLSKEDLVEEEIKKVKLRIPCSFYYWNPIDSKWSNVYTGILGTGCGLEVIPPLEDIVIKNILINFSGLIKFNYSYGIGKDDKYKLNYNSLSFGCPVNAYFHFSDIHCAYLGLGPFFEFEIMEVSPKYSNPEMHYQNGCILETLIGYELTFNKYFNLFSEIVIDFHLADSSFITIRPTIGTVFNIIRK